MAGRRFALGRISPWFWCWWGLCSLSLEGVSAWVSLSRHSTQLALDAVLDARVTKLLTVGALFRTAYKDVTLQGSSDTDCYVAVGDIRGFDRALFETPQVCLQMEIFPDPDRGQPVDYGLPQAVILGIQGSQATVAGLNYFGQYSQVTFDNPEPINLPYETYPVALATDPMGGVFLGLHETAGILPPSATNEDDELQQLYDYHQKLTQPDKTTHVISPEIIKLDVLTGETEWTIALETTGGRSVIAQILYLSRDILVVAGSSNGSGRFVGQERSGDDWDGFVTLIPAVSGAAPNETAWAETSLGIFSQPGLNDYVTGICYQEGVEGGSLYVLGSTAGRMSPDDENGGGFVMKIDIDTLEVKWSYQWNGDGVKPLECYTQQDFIYVAGHVPANVLLEEDETRTEASPDQDLLVALLSTTDGSLRWTRQIDSRRPDHLAGAAISVVSDIIVTANGMNFEDGTSDIYTMTVSQQTGFHDWQELPRSADPIGSSATNAGEENLTGGGDKTFEQIVDDEDNRAVVIAVAVVVPVVLLLLVFVCFRDRLGSSSSAKAQADEFVV